MGDFGLYLKQCRQTKHFSIRKLSKLANFSDGNLSKIERGKRLPPNTREKLLKLVKPLKLNHFQVDHLEALAIEEHKSFVIRKWNGGDL